MRRDGDLPVTFLELLFPFLTEAFMRLVWDVDLLALAVVYCTRKRTVRSLSPAGLKRPDGCVSRRGPETVKYRSGERARNAGAAVRRMPKLLRLFGPGGFYNLTPQSRSLVCNVTSRRGVTVRVRSWQCGVSCCAQATLSARAACLISMLSSVQFSARLFFC